MLTYEQPTEQEPMYRKYEILLPVTEDEEENLRRFQEECRRLERQCFSQSHG